MKMQLIDGKFNHVFEERENIYNVVCAETHKVEKINLDEVDPAHVIIIDRKHLKDSWKKKQDEWFPKNAIRMSTGILWPIFLQHIFPIALDVGKVYCAIMIIKEMYIQRRGGKEGDASDFGAIIRYGKWYVILALIPFFVDLIDGVAQDAKENIEGLKN